MSPILTGQVRTVGGARPTDRFARFALQVKRQVVTDCCGFAQLQFGFDLGPFQWHRNSMSDPFDANPVQHKPTRADWLRYVALIVFWGSAFSLTKVSVEELPPSVVVFARLSIGVAILWLWMLFRGQRMPALLPRPDIRWLWFIPVGATGAGLPFLLISYSVQTVDSGLVGILLATMPLGVAFLSHFFVKGGQLTWYRIAGLVLGLAGVIIIMGPESLLHMGSEPPLAQLAILGAAFCYALNAILIHFMPETHSSVMATGMMLIAAIMQAPFAFADMAHVAAMPSMTVWACLIALGLISTGLASILYTQVVKSAGPNFIASANYFMPPFAVIVGMVFLHERFQVTAFVALAVILLGLYLERKS